MNSSLAAAKTDNGPWTVIAAARPGFGAFQLQAIRDSGMHPKSVDVTTASYRMVMPSGEILFDLRTLDPTPMGCTMMELMAPFLSVDMVEWIARVFLAPDIAELKALLLEQRAIVRFERRVSHDIGAHVIPAECTLLAIETLERGTAMLESGELVIDSITRMLGLRSKVRSLMYQTPDPQKSLSETTIWRAGSR